MNISLREGPNNSQAFSIPGKMLERYPSRVRQGFREIGKTLRKESIEATRRKDKAGRKYVVAKTSKAGKVSQKTYISSAPGQSHAQVSGELGQSIDFTVNGAKKMQYGYDNSRKRGVFLEKGTSKMAARPTLRNAMQDKREVNEAIMKNNLKPENLIR